MNNIGTFDSQPIAPARTPKPAFIYKEKELGYTNTPNVTPIESRPISLTPYGQIPVNNLPTTIPTGTQTQTQTSGTGSGFANISTGLGNLLGGVAGVVGAFKTNQNTSLDIERERTEQLRLQQQYMAGQGFTAGGQQIQPNNNRTLVIVAVIVIAVIGIGYFAFKS